MFCVIKKTLNSNFNIIICLVFSYDKRFRFQYRKIVVGGRKGYINYKGILDSKIIIIRSCNISYFFSLIVLPRYIK